MTLAEHARALAQAFTVHLAECATLPPDQAFALAPRRVVVCAPITDETTYLVALHEMGHICAPTGALNDRPRALNVMQDEEAAAWAWARHYAIEWTPVMEQLAAYAEGTYHAPAVVAAAAAAPPPTPPAPVVPPPTPKHPVINWDDWTKKGQRR